MNRIILILISLLILEQASFSGYGNLPRKGYNKTLKSTAIFEPYTITTHETVITHEEDSLDIEDLRDFSEENKCQK